MLTQKYDENVLERQTIRPGSKALDSHNVDIRRRRLQPWRYVLLCLTGKTPSAMARGAEADLHQTRQPKPIRSLRQDIPASADCRHRKNDGQGPGPALQTPMEVAQALAPWTQAMIAPPLRSEMRS